MEIIKKDKKILFIFPEEQKRCNPYNHMALEDARGNCEKAGCTGTYPTFLGIIDEDQWGNEEMGFALNIDMDYKGKGDQYTDIMIKYWDGGIKEFTKLCRELNIAYCDLRKFKQPIV